MAGPRYFNRVRESCAAPGTGAVTLLGAAAGYQAFADRLSDGDTCYAVIADQSGDNWEVGLVTFHAGGTLSRSAGNVIDGSSGVGTLVNFSSGTQDVFLDTPSPLFPDGATLLVPSTRRVSAGAGLSGGGALSGDVTITLPNVGTAGTYNNVTTDAQGRVTSGSNVAYLTANQTITLQGDATGSGATTITVALKNSGVSAGTYGDATHVAQVTFDAQGRATSASSVPISAGTTSPLTTKGDLWGFDTADDRVPVGGDGTVLTADSSQVLGVKWVLPTGLLFSGSGAPSAGLGNSGDYYLDTAGGVLYLKS